MTYDGEFKYPLERYGNNSVTLSGVLTDICLKAGMAPTSVISSAVSQSLRGYVVSRRMAAREALEPLLGSFFHRCRGNRTVSCVSYRVAAHPWPPSARTIWGP
jgi:hypothetical protein